MGRIENGERKCDAWNQRRHARHVHAHGQALALAEPRGMRPVVAHCHLGLGKLHLRTDKPREAQEHLTTATTLYRDMGMTYWLEKAEAASAAGAS